MALQAQIQQLKTELYKSQGEFSARIFSEFSGNFSDFNSRYTAMVQEISSGGLKVPVCHLWHLSNTCHPDIFRFLKLPRALRKSLKVSSTESTSWKD